MSLHFDLAIDPKKKKHLDIVTLTFLVKEEPKISELPRNLTGGNSHLYT